MGTRLLTRVSWQPIVDRRRRHRGMAGRNRDLMQISHDIADGIKPVHAGLLVLIDNQRADLFCNYATDVFAAGFFFWASAGFFLGAASIGWPWVSCGAGGQTGGGGGGGRWAIKSAAFWTAFAAEART